MEIDREFVGDGHGSESPLVSGRMVQAPVLTVAR
jgi:hypothetical protein